MKCIIESLKQKVKSIHRLNCSQMRMRNANEDANAYSDYNAGGGGYRIGSPLLRKGVLKLIRTPVII